MATDNKSQTVQAVFDDLLKRVAGLKGVLAADKDGVVLCKALDASLAERKLDTLTGALSAMCAATEQASKLQLGAAACVVTTFDNLTAVHTFTSPLLLTLIASNDSNTAQLMSIAGDLRAKVTPLRDAIAK